MALGLGAAACSRPWMGLVTALAVVLARYVPRSRILIAFSVPVILAASRITHTHELAWLSVALLLADLAGLWLHGRSRPVDDRASMRE